jgi:hypothetical protein
VNQLYLGEMMQAFSRFRGENNIMACLDSFGVN